MTEPANKADAGSVTAVLVLYRCTAEQSPCFRSLRDALLELPSGCPAALSLVLYDNSPEPAAAPAFPFPLTSLHDARNGGVAAAYNAGLQHARQHGSDWVLLLDQDTLLTPAYLLELLEATRNVPGTVAAIVPRLQQDGGTHSPHLPPRLSHRALPPSAAGLLSGEVSAFNSGAAIRVAALDRFPERYWLDFLDHAVFSELQARGGRIWLLRSGLEHRLSTQKLGEEASLDRYRNVVLAERDFYRDYGTLSGRLFYRVRRLKQSAGHFLKVPDKRFALLSLRAALGLLGATPPRRAQHQPASNAR